MRNFYLKVFLISYLAISQIACEKSENVGAKKKNLIAIFVEDLGFHDLSFRGSGEIPTYNIDALVYNGILLNK